MCQHRLLPELISEVFPIEEPVGIDILQQLLPPKDTSRPLGCSACFHVGHGLHNFYLLVLELVRTESEICLAGIK
jgi:hypothetical protein